MGNCRFDTVPFSVRIAVVAHMHKSRSWASGQPKYTAIGSRTLQHGPRRTGTTGCTLAEAGAQRLHLPRPNLVLGQLSVQSHRRRSRHILPVARGEVIHIIGWRGRDSIS